MGSTRRRLLRLGGAAVAGLAGCASVHGGRPSTDADSTGPPGGAPPCDEYVYRPSAEAADGGLPWDVQVRNVGLAAYPVTVTVEEVSGGEPVVSCTATSDEHAELAFDLSPGTAYRVSATLHRPTPQSASTTVTGTPDANEAVEVTVEDGDLLVRRVHYDRGRPA